MKKYLALSALMVILALSACSKNKHEADFSAGDITAHINYETQWLSVSETSVASYKSKWFSLFGHDFYTTLGEDFFKKELDIAYNPGDSYGDPILVFPSKKMLVIGLGGTQGRSIIAIVQKNSQPQVLTLVGCFASGNGSVFTRLGRQAGWQCAAAADEPYLKNNGTLYQKLQISEHATYWIDYKTEDIVEIPENSFNLAGSCLKNPHAADSAVGVAGLDNTRQHLLMLYRTKVKNTFNLCAITAAKGPVDSTYQCFSFQANNQPPENKKISEKAAPPVPASMYMRLEQGDDGAVEKRAQWLSAYFDFKSSTDNKPLSAKAGTKVIATASGTIARDKIAADQERSKSLCND